MPAPSRTDTSTTDRQLLPLRLVLREQPGGGHLLAGEHGRDQPVAQRPGEREKEGLEGFTVRPWRQCGTRHPRPHPSHPYPAANCANGSDRPPARSTVCEMNAVGGGAALTRTIAYRFAVRDRLLAHSIDVLASCRSRKGSLRMSPPPPPLGRSRRKDGPDHAFDPALDDAELVAARAALAQGRWTGGPRAARPTGDDWDRRGHRRRRPRRRSPYSRRVGRGTGGSPSPTAADAAVLLALAPSSAPCAARASPDAGPRACRPRPRWRPPTPPPGSALLMLERAPGTDDERARAFDEVRARHPDHHHAHHLMVARLAERARRRRARTRCTRSTTSPTGPPNRPPPTRRSPSCRSSRTPSATGCWPPPGTSRPTPPPPATGPDAGPGR